METSINYEEHLDLPPSYDDLFPPSYKMAVNIFLSDLAKLSENDQQLYKKEMLSRVREVLKTDEENSFKISTE